MHGELVASWLCHDIDVIAHGPFFDTAERDALLAGVPDGITPHWLQLRSSYEVALDRVNVDPSRELSKDPAILRLAYDRAEALTSGLPPGRWTFDTSVTPRQQIVREVAKGLAG